MPKSADALIWHYYEKTLSRSKNPIKCKLCEIRSQLLTNLRGQRISITSDSWQKPSQSSERVFSQAGILYANKQRNRLSGERA